jgi:hypothetical protein
MRAGVGGVIRARLIAAGIALAVLLAIVWAIYHSGERTGAARVTQGAERQHSARAAEARADEQAAAAVSDSIGRRVARADDLSTQAVKATIKDLRDAIESVPPAAAGDPVPAAAVDRLQDSLNAGIDRANRAAEDPAALPRSGQDGAS